MWSIPKSSGWNSDFQCARVNDLGFCVSLMASWTGGPYATAMGWVNGPAVIKQFGNCNPGLDPNSFQTAKGQELSCHCGKTG